MFILYRLTFPWGRGCNEGRAPTRMKPASMGSTCMNEPCWALLTGDFHRLSGFPEIVLFQHFVLGEAEKRAIQLRSEWN